MKFKTKFMICLILLVLFTVSAVSASENATELNLQDDVSVSSEISNETSLGSSEDLLKDTSSDVVGDEDDFGNYEAKIIAKDVSLQYDPYDKTFLVQVRDLDGDVVFPDALTILWDNKVEDCSFNDYKNYYTVDAAAQSVGNHKVRISLDDSYFEADPVTINVKITKAPVKVVAKKTTSRTDRYTTLKAIVKDSKGHRVQEGTVTFSVDGKSYKVKVRNGVATKKIRLKKAKTYLYKATFSSKNYKTKSSHARAYVKKHKMYTIRIGKYIAKLTVNQYKYLKEVSKTSKWRYFDVECSNIKGYTIAINHYRTHFSKMNNRYYQEGFYASVWKTSMGKDGMKIYDKRIYI